MYCLASAGGSDAFGVIIKGPLIKTVYALWRL